MANTLKFGNGEWAIKESYVLGFNDENENFKPLPFNIIRNTKATTVNKDGFIEVVNRNVPRIDFSKDSQGVLLSEPTRTNYCENSLDASKWEQLISIDGSTIETTSNYAISPDGKQNATRLQASMGVSGYAMLELAQTNAFTGYYTSSVYVKSNNGNTQKVTFYGRLSEEPYIREVSNEWQRIEILGRISSGDVGFANLGIHNADNTDTSIDILVWGGQLEQGIFKTSIIPTSEGIGTRVLDICRGGNELIFNSIEGVFFAEINSIDNSSFTAISISEDDKIFNRILFIQETLGKIRIICNSDGALQYDFITQTRYPLESYKKIAFSYKENEFKLYINGEKVNEQYTVLKPPINLSRISLNGTYGGETLKGGCKQIKHYNTALTHEELVKLTS